MTLKESIKLQLVKFNETYPEGRGKESYVFIDSDVNIVDKSDMALHFYIEDKKSLVVDYERFSKEMLSRVEKYIPKGKLRESVIDKITKQPFIIEEEDNELLSSISQDQLDIALTEIFIKTIISVLSDYQNKNLVK